VLVPYLDAEHGWVEIEYFLDAGRGAAGVINLDAASGGEE